MTRIFRVGSLAQALLLVAGCTVGSPQKPSDGFNVPTRDAAPEDTRRGDGPATDLLRCTFPEELCGSECVDTRSRFNHCGTCNNRCVDRYGSRANACSDSNCICDAAAALCLPDEFCTTTGCDTECPEQQQCGAQCCTTSQTCLGGACCANDRVCDRVCCASDQTCIGEACCPAARSCDGICCASNETCIDNACCATTDVCNSDECCTLSEDCLADGCCARTQVCGSPAVCCANDQTCVDDDCCANGKVCGSPATCCTSDQTCVDDDCCANGKVCGSPVTCCTSDQTCVGDACCAAGRACGNVCCGSGQLCLAGPFGPVCTTRPSGASAFYLTVAPLSGDLGGQGGIDTECARQMPASLATPNCFAPAAFLSHSASAQISTMPSYYGLDETEALYWFNRTTNVLTSFASNWADALDDSIALSVADGTGQTFGASDYLWTGSNSDGTYASAAPDDYTCLGWTTTSAANTQGMSGAPSSLTGWIDHALRACSEMAYVLCVCKVAP